MIYTRGEGCNSSGLCKVNAIITFRTSAGTMVRSLEFKKELAIFGLPSATLLAKQKLNQRVPGLANNNRIVKNVTCLACLKFV